MTAYLRSIYEVKSPFSSAYGKNNAVKNGGTVQKYDAFEKSNASLSSEYYCNYDNKGIYEGKGKGEKTEDTSDSSAGGGESGDAEVKRKIVSRNGIKFLEITTTYPDGSTTVETQVLDGYKSKIKNEANIRTELGDSLGELAMM